MSFVGEKTPQLALTDQLREIHVPEDPHDDGRLRVLGVGPLCGAQGSQHRQNVA